MHLLEELELALQRSEHRAVADEADQLRRGEAPPEPARQRAEPDRRHRGGDEKRQAEVPFDHAGRSQRKQQDDRRRRHRYPAEDRRDLVGGEMPERPVVAVIEPDHLRQQRPERQEQERPERPRPGTVTISVARDAADMSARASNRRRRASRHQRPRRAGMTPRPVAISGVTDSSGSARALSNDLRTGEVRHLNPHPHLSP